MKATHFEVRQEMNVRGYPEFTLLGRRTTLKSARSLVEDSGFGKYIINRITRVQTIKN